MKTLVTVLCLINVSLFSQSFDTTNVVTGWNLIGSLRTGSAVQVLTTIPSGIITSSMYGFSPGIGYEPEENIKKGAGYWVKVSQNGKILWTSTISGGGSCPGTPTVVYGGKTYNTVQIGSQCWLKENLDVGTMIQGTQLATNNGIIEKYCYINDPNYCNLYGALYQWDEAMQYIITQGTQGICPSGWHIPTVAEFEILSAAVNMDANTLKAVGQGSGGGAGNNASGWSSFLTGRRYSNGTFGSFGVIGVFWLSTQFNDFYGLYGHLYNTGRNISITDLSKKYGFSVRCIKNP